ncbi:glycosyltransferase family 4 protein [Marinomonas sp. 15G1-11]|uniref:Glycosyltransferase family 4 protein n=1 Tax=Marinomonas phaeophyticola TaxID=3004091 RepID=A0ABT4JS21_9GAMM|nr:glycosyltransferase family 4 protein [Marinomonas sp. 15G1-11]MCZ2720971.1 glycosyltransferase family 4 protein [Marinomonas sp. 15G1-11]
MIFLFIHQNFPAQFRHVAQSLSEKKEHKVIGLGEVKNIKRSLSLFPNILCYGYEFTSSGGEKTHHYLKEHEQHIRRGQVVVRSLIGLKEKGIKPDVIVAHSGWGEALFIRQVFPTARIIHYCEYFYHSNGADVGFDPEFPSSFDNEFKMPIRNSTQLLGLLQCDLAVSPTAWQRSLYPSEFLPKIRELHEGIDTDIFKPNAEVVLKICEHEFTKDNQIITFVSRNLEPYRGFHQFMRALPKMQLMCPDAHIIIVGGNDVSYGSKLSNGLTYKQKYIKELNSLSQIDVAVDWTKVHFTGKLPYVEYLKVLQVSSVHVYLTYPFVLSWSMLEAMSVGCVLVASSTTPVEEIITSGVDGLLVDFFDQNSLLKQVQDVVLNPEKYLDMRKSARKLMQEKYDLQRIILPKWIKFVEGDLMD